MQLVDQAQVGFALHSANASVGQLCAQTPVVAEYEHVVVFWHAVAPRLEQAVVHDVELGAWHTGSDKHSVSDEVDEHDV